MTEEPRFDTAEGGGERLVGVFDGTGVGENGPVRREGPRAEAEVTGRAALSGAGGTRSESGRFRWRLLASKIPAEGDSGPALGKVELPFFFFFLSCRFGLLMVFFSVLTRLR